MSEQEFKNSLEYLMKNGCENINCKDCFLDKKDGDTEVSLCFTLSGIAEIKEREKTGHK